jgi:putative peptidoglycan lipid II flippase
VINVVQNALNIVLAIALVGRYDIGGLAVALAVSYAACALWALQVLRYKVPGFPLGDVLGSLWRMVLAGVIAGEVTWLVAREVGGDEGAAGVMRVVVGAVVGLVVYLGVLAALRAPELSSAWARLTRRGGGVATPASPPPG